MWGRVVRAQSVAGLLVLGLLFGGCSQSPLVDRLVSMEPELTDIEIESAERIARYADESDNGFLPGYSASHVQAYLPRDDYDLAGEELRAAVEALGWEFVLISPHRTSSVSWCASKPDPEIAENLITVLIEVPLDPRPGERVLLQVAPHTILCPPDTGQ